MPCKVISTEPLTKLLCKINRQSILGCVARIEADHVVMACHIAEQIAFTVAQVSTITGNGEIIFATVDCCHAVVISGISRP